MRKKADLITVKNIPENFDNIQKRFAALGLNDEELYNQVEYYKKELYESLEKIERLEKEILELKKFKNRVLNRNLGSQFGAC